MATEVKRRRRRAAPVGIAPSEPERDILDQYLYEVSTYPLLKGTEEIDVARKIRAGDPDALQDALDDARSRGKSGWAEPIDKSLKSLGLVGSQ